MGNSRAAISSPETSLRTKSNCGMPSGTAGGGMFPCPMMCSTPRWDAGLLLADGTCVRYAWSEWLHERTGRASLHLECSYCSTSTHSKDPLLRQRPQVFSTVPFNSGSLEMEPPAILRWDQQETRVTLRDQKPSRMEHRQHGISGSASHNAML